MQTKRHLEFWYEFGSPYSYLSISRVEALAKTYGVNLVWCPFLLGPIFSEIGWKTSPFNLYADKGRYMWRDVERRAQKYGLAFNRLPSSGVGAFPQNGLNAARLALIGLDKGWGQCFSKRVYHAQFVDGCDIGNVSTLHEIARRAGASAEDLEAAQSSANKRVLKDQTDRARGLGIFGAPAFIAGTELFWGDDRLEDAFEHLVAAD